MKVRHVFCVERESAWRVPLMASIGSRFSVGVHGASSCDEIMTEMLDQQEPFILMVSGSLLFVDTHCVPFLRLVRDLHGEDGAELLAALFILTEDVDSELADALNLFLPKKPLIFLIDKHQALEELLPLLEQWLPLRG